MFHRTIRIRDLRVYGDRYIVGLKVKGKNCALSNGIYSIESDLTFKYFLKKYPNLNLHQIGSFFRVITTISSSFEHTFYLDKGNRVIIRKDSRCFLDHLLGIHKSKIQEEGLHHITKELRKISSGISLKLLKIKRQ